MHVADVLRRKFFFIPSAKIQLKVIRSSAHSCYDIFYPTSPWHVLLLLYDPDFNKYLLSNASRFSLLPIRPILDLKKPVLDSDRNVRDVVISGMVIMRDAFYVKAHKRASDLAARLGCHLILPSNADIEKEENSFSGKANKILWIAYLIGIPLFSLVILLALLRSILK